MVITSSSSVPTQAVEKTEIVAVQESDSLQAPTWRPEKKEWLILITLTWITLMVAIDATILVAALPVIAADLHGTATDTFWVGTSYLLASTIVQPFLVNLSDIFGRRTLLLTSLSLFTIGSIVCCVSQNFTTLLTGRSIQGIGGGGCLALIYVIITDIIPLRYRPKYQSLTQAAWAIATICGPVIGGLLAQHTTWRWIFYLNFPLIAIGAFLTVLVVNFEDPRPHLTLTQKANSVDWIGGVLFTGSTCAFLLGLTWAGSEFSWSSAQTLVPLVVGIVFVGVSVYWEKFRVRQPFLRLNLFNCLTSSAAYFCTFIQGILLFCYLYYLPFFFEVCKDFSPTLSGVALIPISVAMMPASIAVSLVVTRRARYRWAIWSGWVVLITSLGCIILFNEDVPSSSWIPILFFGGLGHGMLLMSLVACIQASAPTKDVAYAAAMYTFIRTFGNVVGVAIGGTVFQNVMKTHLGDLGLPLEVAKNSEAFVAQFKSMSDTDSTKALFKTAYSRSFVNMWEVGLAITILGALPSLLVKHYDMNKQLDSEHVVQREAWRSRSACIPDLSKAV